jgi:glucose-1-phosphate cytidylyltransferase
MKLHRKNQLKATLTAVQPPGRYGALGIKGDYVTQFHEKPEGDGAWVNGGFFVLEPSVIDYVANDAMPWERYPLEQLAKENELSVYKHYGFWRPMDTLRDKNQLEELWDSEQAPWKIW